MINDFIYIPYKMCFLYIIINYIRNVRARGPVEQWLGSVENAMFDIVKKLVTLYLFNLDVLYSI